MPKYRNIQKYENKNIRNYSWNDNGTETFSQSWVNSYIVWPGLMCLGSYINKKKIAVLHFRNK